MPTIFFEMPHFLWDKEEGISKREEGKSIKLILLLRGILMFLSRLSLKVKLYLTSSVGTQN